MQNTLFLITLLFSIQLNYAQGRENSEMSNEELLKTFFNDISISKSDSVRAYKYVKIASLYRKMHQLDSSLFYANIAKRISKKNHLIALLGQSLLAEGTTLYRMTNYSDAKIKMDSAITYFKQSNELYALSSTHVNLGSIYFQENNLSKALMHYHKSLDITKELKEPKQELAVMFNISLIYFQLESYKKSNEYLDKMIVLKKENKLEDFLSAFIFHTKGSNYFKMKKYETAKNNYQEALHYAILSEDNRTEYLVYLDFAELFLLQNEVEKAEVNYIKALKKMKSMDAVFEEYGVLYVGLANVSLLKKKYDEAILYGKKGLSYAIDLKQTEYERDAYEILAESYELKNDYKKSLHYFKDYQALKDTLLNAKNFEQVQELETQYQTQQKENKILKLTNENIQKENQIVQSRFLNLGILSAFALTLALGYFLWNRRKQKYRLILLENSIKSGEAEKVRIGKELHDNIACNLMKLVHDSEAAQTQISQKLLKTYNEVRDLSHQLNNIPVRGELFVERLMEIIPESTAEKKFEFDLTPCHLKLDEPYGTHIFRIIQELITNNLKHADAQLTKLSIKYENDVLFIDYHDNGGGSEALKKGNGIKGIEERVAVMQGKLNINHENGFAVLVKIPYTT